MRRLLRSIARGEPEITQDMSTLENPAFIEQLRGALRALLRRQGAPPGQTGKSGKGKNLASRQKTDKTRSL